MSSETQPRILFIDDIPELCSEMTELLGSAGLPLETSLSPLKSLPAILEGRYDLVITGMVIAELHGFDIIRRIRGGGSRVPIIMITGYGTDESAIEAARLGVADYLTKPIEPKEVVARVRRVLAESARKQQKQPRTLARLISADPAMNAIFDRVQTIAPTNSRVLILGETGCGKQLLANAIHQQSPRAKEPFIEVNCAAIPANLLESELFGHEQGSFTGASRKRIGRFEAAGKGTIFLDEIGELDFDLQAKLLHVLDNGQFCRVGGSQVYHSEARLVSATNRDLLQEVEAGRFRSDLYYRLNVISMKLPPLRDRPGDVALLAQHFMHKFVPDGQVPPEFTSAALDVLSRYNWPGNIRELQNAAEQLAVLSMGPRIEVTDLPQHIVEHVLSRDSNGPTAKQPASASASASNGHELPFREARLQFERTYLTNVIHEAKGNLAEAARLAGMDRAQFYRLTKRHGLTRLGQE